ncbi:MAG: Asp23/Gls24 family envelope stress response protein [Candidatus Kaelpia aquatica]|nr:Asp23/Gls24 family envelope stress response protein [Candidatus Kaelpia aquatica]
MEFKKSNDGDIKIHNEVITVIVRKAALEVEGVENIASGFKKGLLSFLGRKKFSRGVTIDESKDGELKVSIAIVVALGVNIPDIVNRVQSNIKAMLDQMTGIIPEKINVEVDKVEDRSIHGVIEKIKVDKKLSKEDKDEVEG